MHELYLRKNHKFLSAAGLVRQICKPLQHFKIHLFTYLKKYPDGSEINLSTNPEWIADYYNLALYRTSLYEANPDGYQAGITIWPLDSNLAVFNHGRLYFKSNYGFTISKKYKDACEFYFFSIASDDYQQLNVCINNMDLIEQFILYFKEQAVTLLKACENNKVVIPIQRSIPQPVTEPPAINIRAEFLREIRGNNLANLLNAHEPLTKREQECLNLLLVKPTAIELAKELHISKRTAETHLERIKSKLNCNSKQELLIKIVQASGKYLHETTPY